MSDEEELFWHEVQGRTVGQLRAALTGRPDEVRLRIEHAEAPGSNVSGGEQVVIGAGLEEQVWDPEQQKHHKVERPSGRNRPWFEISCDFPTGEYYRKRP